MSFEDYLEKPELTLRLENIATYEDGKGDHVIWQDGKRTGPGPKHVILKGPMEFTFQLENVLPAARYTGDVKISADKVPLRFTNFAIGPFELNADYAVPAPVGFTPASKPGQPEPQPNPDKLSDQDVTKALYRVIQGLWTKDGKYLDLSQRGGGMGMTTSQDGTVKGNAGVSYPYPIDPAAVTAVKLGETRVELSGWKLQAE